MPIATLSFGSIIKNNQENKIMPISFKQVKENFDKERTVTIPTALLESIDEQIGINFNGTRSHVVLTEVALDEFLKSSEPNKNLFLKRQIYYNLLRQIYYNLFDAITKKYLEFGWCVSYAEDQPDRTQYVLYFSEAVPKRRLYFTRQEYAERRNEHEKTMTYKDYQKYLSELNKEYRRLSKKEGP